MHVLSSTMSYFKISLGYRLLLATIPTVGLFLVDLISHLVGGSDWNGPSSWDWAVSIIYAALFGAFVLVPFITTKSSLVLRVSALVLASILIPPVWLLIDEAAGWSLEVSIYFLMFGVVATTLLFAVVLVFAASLRVSRLYWLYTALAGIIGAFILLSSALECLFGACPPWKGYLPAIALLIWQFLFCTAVYFGRTGSRRGPQTASQRQKTVERSQE